MASVRAHGVLSKAPDQSICSAYSGEGVSGHVDAWVMSNAICRGSIRSCVSPSGMKPTFAGCRTGYCLRSLPIRCAISFAMILSSAVERVIGRTFDRSVGSPLGNRMISLYSSRIGMFVGSCRISLMISSNFSLAMFGSSLNSGMRSPGDAAPLFDLLITYSNSS